MDGALLRAGEDAQRLRGELVETGDRLRAESAQAAGLAVRAESAETALSRAEARWAAMERRIPMRLYRLAQRLFTAPPT